MYVICIHLYTVYSTAIVVKSTEVQALGAL